MMEFFLKKKGLNMKYVIEWTFKVVKIYYSNNLVTF